MSQDTVLDLPLEGQVLRELIEQRLLKDGRRNILTFVGPYTYNVAGVPYFVLTSYGIKPEGGEIFPVDGRPIAKSAQQALDWLMDRLAYMLDESKPTQIAWRRMPEIHCSTEADRRQMAKDFPGEIVDVEGGDKWYATGRLALLCCERAP